MARLPGTKLRFLELLELWLSPLKIVVDIGETLLPSDVHKDARAGLAITLATEAAVAHLSTWRAQPCLQITHSHSETSHTSYYWCLIMFFFWSLIKTVETYQI